jgi:hypothetical protein
MQAIPRLQPESLALPNVSALAAVGVRRSDSITVDAIGGFKAPTLVALAAPTTSPKQVRYESALAAYALANSDHEERATKYWDLVAAKRKGRSGRKLADLTDDDFVNTQPPVYKGPKKPNPLDYGLPAPPSAKKDAIPTVPDFIASADKMGFKFDLLRDDATPAQQAAFEHRFKERYAAIALKEGLTREQILGVFAFEDGGVGTYDNEAGIDPGKRTGRAISSALGYGQLLTDNSIDVTAHYGESIAAKLDAEGKHAKAELMRTMTKKVQAVYGPDPTWAQCGLIAKTDLGRGVHAANLDPDIGPYVQIIKLTDINDLYVKYAKANGMAGIPASPEMMESMNLAGPTSGFAMAHKLIAKRLTVNFFQRNGYERNPVVTEMVDGVRRARTAEGLEKHMHEIMHGPYSQAAGYKEFEAIFDKLQRRSARRN